MNSIVQDYITALTPKTRGLLKGTAKLVILDAGEVMLDTTGASKETGAADVTLVATDAVFRAIMSGDQNPVMAFMSGKLKVEGNPKRALKVSSLLVD